MSSSENEHFTLGLGGRDEFRCDEIAGAALAEFNEQAKPQRKPVEGGRVVDGLGGMMRAWRSGALGKSIRCVSSRVI